MLAKKRSLKLNGLEIERTPLLVPSFSSKGFPQAREIVKYSSELIEGPALVSAYDLHYRHISPPFDFASLIFLDSGGYEASKDIDLSDFEERDHTPQTWTQEFHRAVIADWNPRVPSVLISYDNPKERLSTVEQIERARQIAPSRNDVLREILLKPETPKGPRLAIQSVIKNIHRLADFDIIGVTEKEIGSSILERMKNIGLLRRALNRVGLEIPIHVFGSLDTITTPMYFLAGADIFDGLTWLRFAYHDGRTLYKQNYGATVGISTKAHVLDGICWNNNYRYLQELQLEMRRFLGTENFNSFKFNANLFQTALETAMEQIGAEDGR
jgi:hypothetical protein